LHSNTILYDRQLKLQQYSNTLGRWRIAVSRLGQPHDRFAKGDRSKRLHQSGCQADGLELQRRLANHRKSQQRRAEALVSTATGGSKGGGTA